MGTVRLHPKRLGKGVRLPVHLTVGAKKVLERTGTRVSGFELVSKSQAKFFKGFNLRYNTHGYPIVSSKRLPKPFRTHAVGVHVVAYYLAHGKIPKGLQIDHINANRGDARIGNLQAITGAQNVGKISLASRRRGLKRGAITFKARTGLNLAQYRAKTIGFAGLSKIAKKIAKNLGTKGLHDKAVKAAHTKGALGLSAAAKKGAQTLGKKGILARNKKISASLMGHKSFRPKSKAKVFRVR